MYLALDAVGNSLGGVFDKVDKHTRNLLLVGHDGNIVIAGKVGCNFHILSIFKQLHHVAECLHHVERTFVGLGHLGKVGESCGYRRKGVDLLDKRVRHSVEFLLKVGVVVLVAAHKELDAQLHRRERVLNFVGYLLSHLAPSTLALALGQQGGALLKLLHHCVVFRNQLTNLVLAAVLYLLVLLAEFHLLHHILNHADRMHHTLRHNHGDKYAQQHQHHKQVGERHQHSGQLALHNVGFGEIRQVDVSC